MVASRTVLIANPSADTNGADLQVLESVTAMVGRGWRVVVAVPTDGALVDLARQRGAEPVVLPYPMLPRGDVSSPGPAALVASLPAALARAGRLLADLQPDLVYVNTISVPWWLVAARRAGTPALCHVHEAEADDPVLVRKALCAPLFLADRVVVNSRATESVVCGAAPGLRARSTLVRNGVRGPDIPAFPREPGTTYRLVVVGGLSPRKAPHVALEALRLLRRAGRDVALEICGTPPPGQDGYVRELRAFADRPELRGRVTFAGDTSPIWPALQRADVLVAPSLGESFGNAVVEGQLARRPVIATAVQGHLETIQNGVSGLFVTTHDPAGIAASVVRLMDDPVMAREIAFLGMRRAQALFAPERYADEIDRLARELVDGGPVTPRRSDQQAPRAPREQVQPKKRSRRLPGAGELGDVRTDR